MVNRSIWIVIRNSIPCIGLGVITLAANAGHPLPTATSTASSSTGKPALVKNPAGILHLKNDAWAHVRVEVRAGSSTNCDSFGSLGVYVLDRGQEWEVNVDDPVICWRRDQVPGQAGSAWTSWYAVQLASAEDRVLTL